MIESIPTNELLDHLVAVINQAYTTTRAPNGVNNFRVGKSDAKSKVCHLVDFYNWPLAILTDGKAEEVLLWLAKWPIYPGEFDWGVDWRSIKAERVECATCKGKGSWEVEEGGHMHTNHCYYCGGRGYQNRAQRGANVT